jgi:hypothetical protein
VIGLGEVPAPDVFLQLVFDIDLPLAVIGDEMPPPFAGADIAAGLKEFCPWDQDRRRRIGSDSQI